MVPTVNQQLAAIRHTIAKTIMPALDPSADFAQEQAGLILASLDWAMDVVQSEHRYELVEHAEYRTLLEALLALEPGTGEDEARRAIDAAAIPPADLAALRAATVELKALVQEAFFALTATPDAPGALEARRLVTAVARRQSKRESAWARMTGFPANVDGSVGEVLAAQAAA